MPKYFWYQAESQSQLLPGPLLLYGQSATALWPNQRTFWYVQSANSELFGPATILTGQNQEPPAFLLTKRRFDDFVSANNAKILPASLLISHASDTLCPFRRAAFPAQQDIFIPAPLVSGVVLVPGVITLTAQANSNLSFSATDATGGVLPYSYNYEIALHGTGMWTFAGFGTLTNTNITHLAACTSYDVRLQYTDSSTPTAQVVYSNVITASTTGCGAVATCSGTMEWGNCTVTNIDPGAAYVIGGPFQCYDRKSFNQVWFVQGTSAFNLDYMYTPDQGATWYIGKQVSSSTTTVDGGTAGYTQEARFALQPGYQYMIQVYNTSAGAINIAFEHRYVMRKGGG